MPRETSEEFVIYPKNVAPGKVGRAAKILIPVAFWAGVVVALVLTSWYPVALGTAATLVVALAAWVWDQARRRLLP